MYNENEMACPRCLLTVQVDSQGDWKCQHCKLTSKELDDLVEQILSEAKPETEQDDNPSP